MFLLTVFVVEGPGDTMLIRAIGDVPIAAIIIFALAAAALYRRRHEPVAVLAFVLVCWSVTLGSGYSDLGGIAIVALYSVGRWAGELRWGVVGVLCCIAAVTVDSLIASLPWGEIVLGAIVMELAWYIGRRVRLRGERVEQLQREQAAQTRRIVAEERTRIARELHDVVAHRVSLMTVQAGAAKAVAAGDPEAALRAMGAVEQAGREALDELRHLLGVLRPEADLDSLGPQPGLADLPRLLAENREAGLDVSLTSDGMPTQLPVRVGLSAYRIVQESLTNVRKHAGPGTPTEVRLRIDRDLLVIEVDDDGRGATEIPGSGHGILGMRERALLLGGSLDAGPRPGGGYRVVAHLPVTGESA